MQFQGPQLKWSAVNVHASAACADVVALREEQQYLLYIMLESRVERQLLNCVLMQDASENFHTLISGYNVVCT